MTPTLPPLDTRRVSLTRYVAPLREGGSLPALAEADDGFSYVIKFAGAGHGIKALVAEFIGGEIARAAGFNVPEIVFVDLDADFGRTEPDEEIQDLLKASTGLNIGLHFLSGALTYDPAANASAIDPDTASRVVWLDAFLTNVDRTWRNTNMLMWHSARELWLIDHGAALYFHHSWSDPAKAALTPFPYIKDHALLPLASAIDSADSFMHTVITPAVIDRIVDAIPDAWLTPRPDEADAPGPDERRRVYKAFLNTRLNNSKNFVDHAKQARESSL